MESLAPVAIRVYRIWVSDKIVLSLRSYNIIPDELVPDRFENGRWNGFHLMRRHACKSCRNDGAALRIADDIFRMLSFWHSKKGSGLLAHARQVTTSIICASWSTTLEGDPSPSPGSIFISMVGELEPSIVNDYTLNDRVGERKSLQDMRSVFWVYSFIYMTSGSKN